MRPLLATILGLFLFNWTANAADLPPANGKPLSEILLSVEQQKFDVIAEAEFDDGVWEIRARHGDAWQKLYIDPVSGKERHRSPANAEEAPGEDALPLSTVIQSVKKQQSARITEVEFDNGVWEIKLRALGHTRKLFVNPHTGAVK